MRRMSCGVLAGTLALLGGLAACSDKEPPPQPKTTVTGWGSLTDRVGADGEVPLDLALDGFATLVGPIEGGTAAEAADLGATSGTPGIRWVLGHWDELSDTQQQDVLAAYAVATSATTAPARLLSGAPLTVEQIVDQVAAEFRAREPAFDPVPHFVTTYRGPEPDGKDVYAEAWPFGDAGPAVGSMPITDCGIVFLAYGMKLYDRYVDTSNPARSAEALRIIRETAAHELMHCHQYRLVGTTQAWGELPGWVSEGSAEWGGYAFEYSPTPPAYPSAVSWWEEYFANPERDLFRSDYDAVGFWSHASDPWGLLRFSLAQPWASAEQAGAAVLAEKDRSTRPLESYAMAFTRRAMLGAAWDNRGPGLTTQRPPDAPTLVLAAGTSQSQRVPLRAFAYVDLQLEDEVDVVHLSSPVSGALHWGTSASGPDDLVSGDGSDQWFCIDPAECVCPTGLSATPGIALLVRPFREATAAFFGAPASGEAPPEAKSQVRLFADSFDNLLGELCDGPDPYANVDGDDCKTWATPADIQSLVPNSESGTFAQADIVRRPDGLTLVLCRGSAGRGFTEEEPFFTWIIDIHASLVVRGDSSSDENWDAFVAASLSDFDCDRPSLASGLHVCRRTPHEGHVDEIVALGNRLVEVDVGVTRTDNHPDLSTDQVAEAADLLIDYFAAALRSAPCCDAGGGPNS